MRSTCKKTPVRLLRTLIVKERDRQRLRSRTGLNLVLRISIAIVIISLLSSGLLLGAGVGAAAAGYSYFTTDLPTPEEVEAISVQSFETTKIYDNQGNLLYEMIDPNAGDRSWVDLSSLPEHVYCATVASEDRTFWTNPGINPRGLIRAFVNNLQGLSVQGGSSITQQVVKNSVIPLEERYVQDYGRKIKEVLIAIELTRLYEKEEILEWYLNTNFYGNLAYGIDSAARTYFGKSASQLTISEAATLAAVPQSPLMNPFDRPEEALERRDLVLTAMVIEGCITPAQAQAARNEPWQLAVSSQRFDITAPHFSMYVRRQLEQWYGSERVAGGGLRVYTTLDLNLQQQSECVTTAYLRILGGELPDVVIPEALAQGCEAAQYLPDVPANRIGNDYNVHNAAVVVIRPTTGEIVAMVGSADYWNTEIDGKFNVAADGLRQPGSTFKPFTYLTMLSQGYNAAYMFLDVRQAFEQGPGMPPYVPENFSRNYSGPVNMRAALARSLNIPAVEAMAIAGVDNVLRIAHQMGINSLDRGLQHYGLSLTLGGGEVRLLDMTYAFSVFDNNGVMYGAPIPPERLRPGFRELDPVAILRVEDRNGNILYRYDQPEARQILEPRLAYLITNILSDRQARIAGFGSPNIMELTDDRPAAAKTGTTNNYTDNWTIGYTPQYVTGVWMGNTQADNYMINTTGARGAGHIWHAVMEYAHLNEPHIAFTRPDGLIEVQVCTLSGLKPNGHCPVRTEIMIPGTEPQEVDRMHQLFLVNRETGKLATIYTPIELIEERVFEIYPPEAQDWLNSLPEDRRRPVPPMEYDTIYGPNLSGAEVVIISPTTYSYVNGVAPILGNARGGEFAFYRLVLGRGMNPGEWTQIGPDHGNQVDQNVLEFLDTTGLTDGLYTLQLQVIGHDQSVRQFPIQLTIDNTPPRVDLTYPTEGSEYTYGFDEWVNINAEINDNYAIGRVEYYKNEEEAPFNVRTRAPFNINWKLEAPGTYRFHVVVYDAAGNRTETEPVSIQVVPRVTNP